MTTEPLLLYGYWRSGTSYRTRIALNFKGVAYENRPVNLLGKAQRESTYRALNPQALLPTLIVGDRVMTQSSAIIEWLEERYPNPPLLPATPHDRAAVRTMAMIVACDIHPLNNVRVLDALAADYDANLEVKKAWIARWTQEGFSALEAMVSRHGGTNSFGSEFTLADCYIVSQFYSAQRFGVPMDLYPHLRRVVDHAGKHPAVVAAHPDSQPDARLD